MLTCLSEVPCVGCDLVVSDDLMMFELIDPIANVKGHYFQRSLSVSLSVCVCVSDRHVYPSTLTDFDETWSQGPCCDLVWPRT